MAGDTNGHGAVPEAQARWYADELDFHGHVVVDVGANVGVLSECFWRISAGTASLVSVEAHPSNWPALAARRRQTLVDVPVCGVVASDGSACRPGWRVEQLAVSVAAGQLELSGFREDNGSWNCMAQRFNPNQGGGAKSAVDAQGMVTVPCATLHDIEAGAQIIKLDVEGHEYQILDTDLARLSAAKAWLVEFHLVKGRPLERELQRFIDHGYRVYAASSRGGASGVGWVSAEIDGRVTWDQVPVAKRRPDGSVFKMLHIIARR